MPVLPVSEQLAPLRLRRRLAGEDSKFEKLRAVMSDSAFAPEKLVVFTEHRDSAEFLVCRLEELGFVYLEMATTEDGARTAIERLNGRLTREQVAAIDEREHT